MSSLTRSMANADEEWGILTCDVVKREMNEHESYCKKDVQHSISFPRVLFALRMVF